MMSDAPKSSQNEAAQQWIESVNTMVSTWQEAMTNWSDMWNKNLPSTIETASDTLKENNVQNPMEAMQDMANAKLDQEKIMAAQMELWQDYQKLWMHTTSRLMNQEEGPSENGTRDPRFRSESWTDNPVFEFIKESYFLNSKWMKKYLSSMEGLDDDTARKVEFYGEQIVDALAPSNFPLTNPDVLKEIQETKGANLVQGLNNLAEDLKNGSGGLRPRHTRPDDFVVGKDLATTPGSVVYETPLMQLIQYEPATKDVYKKPLLIVPPWINKFYILDLGEENSFIKWSVEQGYTVFVVSWVNPDGAYRDKSFDDYAKEGVFAALEGVEKATGEKQVNAIGYCIGGTLMAAVLAYMAKKHDDRISSITYFAAQVDFEQAGDLKMFSDAQQVETLERQLLGKGYLDAGYMASTFNMLRANDLIWFFHVNNYLMGKEPPKFDLLFWNADATRFPAQLLLDYLKNMYVENRLSKPGGFTLLDEKVDLRDVKIPVYLQATVEDHIAPAESVFKATKLYSGPVRFVLGGSGHIAGVINPPHKNKYQYWTNSSKKSYNSVEAWQKDAKETAGSWWPDWDKWLSKLSGDKVPARKIANAIEPAPGSYVKVRSDG